MHKLSHVRTFLGSAPCSTGWYDIGGTSASAPQWAGLTAIADQMAGHNLGYLNDALYAIANNPAKYAADFFDVNTNCNQLTSIPGYCASQGWDAVTGLGTPKRRQAAPRPDRGHPVICSFHVVCVCGFGSPNSGLPKFSLMIS